MKYLVWFKVLNYWFIWFLWKISVETHCDGGRCYVIISTDIVSQNWVPLSRRLRWWKLTGIFQVWRHFCSWGLGAAYPSHCRYPKPWPGAWFLSETCLKYSGLEPYSGWQWKQWEGKTGCHSCGATTSPLLINLLLSDVVSFRSVNSVPYSVKHLLSFLFAKIWWESWQRIYRVN